MNLLSLLASSDAFGALDRRLLREIADRAAWTELRSGLVLFNQGESADAMYVVANGRLRVSQIRGDGSERLMGEIGREQSIGELALITGTPRATTAYAVRDTGLVGISKDLFDRLLKRYPGEMMQVARFIVSRMERAFAEPYREGRLSTRTIAVLPGHKGAPMAEFTRHLARSLGCGRPTLKVDGVRVDTVLGRGYAATTFDEPSANQFLTGWLNGLEARYHHLVYQASDAPDAWSRRCLRQADRIVVVVNAAEAPADNRQVAMLRAEGIRAPLELVMVHGEDNGASRDTLGWQTVFNAQARHRVHNHSRDVPRIARLITGRALGVVLSGGGARGFAHLGLFKALAERNMEVDLIGGASMGAFMAALYASGLDVGRMIATARDIFVEHNFLNDYAVPRISLIRAGKITRRIEALFGDTLIEDLPIPYYCVSTSLTRGVPVVHDQGLLRTWLLASMAVPGFVPPAVDKGELLVDGGVSNNLPTDVMQEMGRGYILASDVTPTEELRMEGLGEEEPVPLTNVKGGPKPPSIFKLLFRTATLTSELELKAHAGMADLYISMPVGDTGMFDWEAADKLVEMGYERASQALDEALGADAEHGDILRAEPASVATKTG